MEEAPGFARLEPTEKTGEEPLRGAQGLLGPRLVDFWRWSASDLLSNATRGVLAEYIVASALGIARGVRAEWDAFDLVLDANGKRLKIEVKSASYVQSWHHKKLSPITFGIAPTYFLNADLTRQADVYVFCLLGHRIHEAPDPIAFRASLDPLDVGEWKFYVLPTSVLNEKVPAQKTISLGSLARLNPQIVAYEELSGCLQVLAL